MKKTAQKMLALMMVVCTILGIVGLASAEEKTKLTIMVWGQTATMEMAVTSILENNPDFAAKVDIEVITGGSGDPEVAEKYRLALASNVPCADIIQLNYTQLSEFAGVGAVVPLDDVFEPVWDDMLGAAQILSTYNGQIVAAPGAINTKLYYYRKDIFDECGVDPKTWETVDDMIAGAKKIQEKYPDYYIYNMSHTAGAQDYGLYMLFTSFDGKFVDEEGNYILNTDPGVRKAFETLKKLYDSGICYDATDFTSGWEYGLANGTLIGQLTSNWFRYFVSTYAPDAAGKWAACEWPTEIRKGSEAGGSVYVIPTFCTNVELSKEFLRLLRADSEMQDIQFYDNNTVPVLTSSFEKIIERAEHPFLIGNGEESYWETEYYCFNNGYYSIFPYTPKAAAEMVIVNAYSTKFFSGEMDLDTMLNELTMDLQMQIGNPFE